VTQLSTRPSTQTMKVDQGRPVLWLCFPSNSAGGGDQSVGSSHTDCFRSTGSYGEWPAPS
jgi:hypothetical protein